MKLHKFSLLSLSIALATNVAHADELQGVTVFKAKEIITMDDSKPLAEAVAVHQGKIIQVGSEKELINQYSHQPGFSVNIDYADKVITPGFLDPHLHAWLLAMLTPMEFVTPADWNLPWGDVTGVQSEKDFIARVKELDKTKPKGEPLWVWGYHKYFHGSNMSRALLNEISQDRPIVIWQRSFHEIFFNDAGLAMMGWTEQDWQGEAYGYNHMDWETGHVWEQGGTIVFPTLIDQMAKQGMFVTGFERAKEYMQASGITTAIDPGVSVDDATIKTMIDVFEQSDLAMDYWMMPSAFFLNAHAKGDVDAMIAAAKAQTSNPDTQSEQVRWMPKHIKLFTDGAMYSQLMQMKDGYTDGHDGEWMIYPDQLEPIWRGFWKEDYTAVIHSNGDLGFDVGVGILEKLQKEHPRDDHRSDFHHLAFTDKDDIPRAVAAGASFSVNPFYTHVLGENYSQHGIGAERASEMSRGRSFLDAGGILSLHSDSPMAPASPLAMMWAAVNRTGLSGSLLGPQERISPQEALRAVTLDAAYSARLEQQVGSIEVGKYANFTVLDQSPYTVAPETIKDINVAATIYRGHANNTETGRSAGISQEGNNRKIEQILTRIDSARGGDSCATSMNIQRAVSQVDLN
ncbi:amidohydrolase [Vibrio sp. WXL210]|uniref:amidohydrolase n=1 Tax=Vibrio sp. WXL210 TaxID=3450709 RepID=UPI003EC88875